MAESRNTTPRGVEYVVEAEPGWQAVPRPEFPYRPSDPEDMPPLRLQPVLAWRFQANDLTPEALCPRDISGKFCLLVAPDGRVWDSYRDDPWPSLSDAEAELRGEWRDEWLRSQGVDPDAPDAGAAP